MGRWGMSLFINRSGDISAYGFMVLAFASWRVLSAGHVENGIRPFRHRARLHGWRFRTPVAQHSRRAFARTLLVDQVFQGNGVEILDHLLVQRRPQFTRHAMAVVMLRALARTLAAALGGIERFVDGDDDVRDRHILRATREVVAAA